MAMGSVIAGCAVRKVASAVVARGGSVALTRIVSMAGPTGLALAAAGVSVSVFNRIRRDE